MLRSAARFVLCSALLLSLSTLRAEAQKPAPRAPQLVVIDTDIGDDIDDAFAVSLALRTPSFRVLGITTTFGDTQLRAHLTARLLEDAHVSGIPIVAGKPSKAPSKFTQAAYARGDKHPDAPEDAAAFLLKIAAAHPGQVTLIAVGPLNNVGDAIDRDPAAFRKFKRVVLMGGSVVRGYGSKPQAFTHPSPEWNIVNNIAGARKLFAAGVPIAMMPLDSTQIPLVSPEREQILDANASLNKALAELVRESDKPKPILYDPLTVAYAAEPALCPTQPMHIGVDDKGFTRRTPGAANANVCLKSDEAGFLKLLARRLAPQ